MVFQQHGECQVSHHSLITPSAKPSPILGHEEGLGVPQWEGLLRVKGSLSPAPEPEPGGTFEPGAAS